MTRHLRAVAAFAVVAALAVPAAAHAADGSIPPEVHDYVDDGELVLRLADVYGPNHQGEGIDFDDTTTTGEIVRVHEWTPALLAGEDTDQPIQLVNEWIVPISIAEEPVGLAIVWINPDTVLPELASFDADPDLAVALSDIADTAALVHDGTSAAWFALDDDGILTPLVPGSTGLSTPVPLDDVALLAPPSAAPVPSEPDTGLALAIGVIAVLLVVIVVALVLPRRAPVE